MVPFTVLTLLGVAYRRTHRFIPRIYVTWMIIVCVIYVLNVTGGHQHQNGKMRVRDMYTSCNQHINKGITECINSVQPGDILLYRKLRNRNTELIKFFERRENGPQVRGYNHVAIALDNQSKIEANAKRITIEPINYGSFDVFKPPIPQRNTAIDYLMGFVGQPYDWWLVTDDVLRYSTHNVIHLPVAFVQVEEQDKKTCSSLIAHYFSVAK